MAAADSGTPPERVIASLGLASESQIAAALAEYLNTSVIASGALPEEPLLPDLLHAPFLRHHGLVPIAADNAGDSLTLATATDVSEETLEALRFATGRKIALAVATLSDLRAALARLYGDTPGERAPGTEAGGMEGAPGAADSLQEDTERLRDLASEAPVIRLVNQWIADAVARRASDIHIEPTASALRLRYRIDGALRDVAEPERALAPAATPRARHLNKRLAPPPRGLEPFR